MSTILFVTNIIISYLNLVGSYSNTNIIEQQFLPLE